MFATSIVNCFAKNLGQNDFNIVDQILRYLASSQDKDITFWGCDDPQSYYSLSHI